MRKKDILIIGAGGVAHVAAHKVAQNNDILGDLCIASRTQSKCDAIIESIKRKKSSKNPRRKIYSRQIDAMDVPALVQLIEETKSDIVINLGQSFVNMSVLEACIQAGVAYMDTAIHEEPDKVCEARPGTAITSGSAKIAAETRGSPQSWVAGSTPAWSMRGAPTRSSTTSTRSTPSTSWM
jgi:saccharopine dehydrogenase-like NADP-dependent oxidoreductase